MQIGPSRELFELWAPDSRNGLIITGYSVEGTLARVSQQRLLVGFTVYGVFLSFVHKLVQWTLFFPPQNALHAT